MMKGQTYWERGSQKEISRRHYALVSSRDSLIIVMELLAHLDLEIYQIDGIFLKMEN